MNPAERQALLSEFAKMLEPIVARIEKLESTDRVHDRMHRDSRAETRRVASETEKTSTDALLAASQHLDRKLDSIRREARENHQALENRVQENHQALETELRSSLLPRAAGAEAAAVAGAIAAVKTEGAIQAVSIDASSTNQQIVRTRRWSQLAPLITIVTQAIFAGIWAACQH